MLRPRRGAAEAGQGGSDGSRPVRRHRTSVLLLALALAALAVVFVLTQYQRRLGDTERRRVLEEEAAWVSGAAGQLAQKLPEQQSTDS